MDSRRRNGWLAKRVRRRTIAVFCALAVAGGLLRASAADYFVSTEGSDTNPGSIDRPWATIAQGLKKLQPGDTLYLRGGRYHQAVKVRDLGGNQNAPITLAAYPGEKVVLDGTVAVRSPWSRHKGSIYKTTNIYKTTLARHVWQLFVDGKSMSPARWPNGNWNDGSLWDAAASMAWPSTMSTLIGFCT